MRDVANYASHANCANHANVRVLYLCLGLYPGLCASAALALACSNPLANPPNLQQYLAKSATLA